MTKASTSSGVGGRPIRSNVSRRMQRAAVGLGGRRQPLRLQLRQDEAIDGVPRPLGVLHRRHGRPRQRAERPELAVLGGDDERLRLRRRAARAAACRRGRRGRSTWPGRSSCCLGQRLVPLGRHVRLVELGREAVELAGRRLAGVTTAPLSPPLSSVSRVAMSSPPRVLAPPWHFRQATRSGRTDLANSSRPAAMSAACSGGSGGKRQAGRGRGREEAAHGGKLQKAGIWGRLPQMGCAVKEQGSYLTPQPPPRSGEGEPSVLMREACATKASLDSPQSPRTTQRRPLFVTLAGSPSPLRRGGWGVR